MERYRDIFKSKKAKLAVFLVILYVLLWIIANWLWNILGPHHPIISLMVFLLVILTILGMILGPVALVNVLSKVGQIMKERHPKAYKVYREIGEAIKKSIICTIGIIVLAIITYIFYCLTKATYDPFNPNNPVHIVCLLLFIISAMVLVLLIIYLLVTAFIIVLPIIALILPIFFHDPWVPVAQQWIFIIWIFLIPFYGRLKEMIE